MSLVWKTRAGLAAISGGRFVIALMLALLAGPVLAEGNMRATFPGRRVGGGTRSDCTARVLAHLVPEGSVYGLGRSGLLAVLQGPTAEPKPLLLEWRSNNAAAGSDVKRLRFKASGASIALIQGPLELPVIWESSYQCKASEHELRSEDWDSGFDAPPAMSLLVEQSTKVDQDAQAELRKLHAQCDRKVTKDVIIEAFALSEIDLTYWPDRLPVYCHF